MPKSVEEILSLWGKRQKEHGPLVSRAIEIRDTYNGDIVVPLPELDRDEKVAVANLLQVGLDQQAMRISSTQPDVFFPPTKPGVKISEKKSRNSRLATLSWWEQNQMPLKDRRRARWLIGYASAPVVIRPGAHQIPTWHLRDPLSTYPAPSSDPDNIEPEDCIFTFKRSHEWLKANYEEKTIGLSLGDNPNPKDEFQLVEYCDAEEIVLLVVGRETWMGGGGAKAVELERIPTRIDMCPAVVPGRISLDRPMGQFDGLVGLFQQQAKLMALEVIGVQRGIFADQWAVSGEAGRRPKVHVVADGLRGVLGEIEGGQIQNLQSQPTYLAGPTIDRVERAMRQESGIPPEFGAESSSNIRTGRRGDSVISATIDFRIQEAQTLLGMSKEAELRRALAISKKFWGNVSKSFYVSWPKAKGRADYTPNKDFESQPSVTYSQPGTDINALVISGGQRVGIGTLSKEAFMNMDPLVEDVEHEKDRIVTEALDQAMLTGIQEQMAQGAIPPQVVARIKQLVRENRGDLEEAIMQANQELQEQQAELTPEGSPEAQPGLTAPGEPGAIEAIGEGEPSLTNLMFMLNSLRRPQQQSPQERASA